MLAALPAAATAATVATVASACYKADVKRYRVQRPLQLKTKRKKAEQNVPQKVFCFLELRRSLIRR